MTDWKRNARGIHLKGNTPAGDLTAYDFVVAEIGDKFTNNVQAAHDEGIPILLFAPSMLDKSRVDQGPDKSEWKVNNQPIIKELDKYILSNGVKRIIHGIIIDASATDNGEGKPLTPWWITTYTDWLLAEIYKRYKWPVYLYMNNQPMKMANGEGVQLLIGLMAEWNICTVSPATVSNGYPVDAANPVLPYNDPNLIRWDFWLYKVATNEPWLWLYNGVASELYWALNFEKDDLQPIDDEGDIVDLWAAVGALTTQVEELQRTVTGLLAWKDQPLR